MTYQEADQFLTDLVTSKTMRSANDIHRVLKIRQPFGWWFSSRVKHMQTPDDYIKVGKEYYVSPVLAHMLACGGGSKASAMCQVVVADQMSEIFKGQDVMTVIQDGINQVKTEQFLQRELDPERYPE